MAARRFKPPKPGFEDRLSFALYAAMHLLLAPWLAANGWKRRVRRDYVGILARRLHGDAGAAVADLDVLIVSGAMGETRTGVRAARELRVNGYRVALVPSLEGSLRSVTGEPDLPTGVAPFNSPYSVWRFLRAWRPRAIWFIEGNDLPYLAYMANRRKIPCHVVNGYFTEGDERRVRSRPGAKWRYRCIAGWAVQSEAVKNRLVGLGIEADRCIVTGPSIGTTPADEATAEALRAKWRGVLGMGPEDRLIVAGSTYPGEEERIVEALLKLGNPRVRLVLAPRVLFRPESLSDAPDRLAVPSVRRSELPSVGGTPEKLVVLDTLGELRELYALADVAHLGGTFVKDIGGHTPVEALAFGVPFTVGPWYAQQVAMVDLAIASRIAHLCGTSDELAAVWRRLLDEPDPSRQERCRFLVERQSRVFGDYWGLA